MEGPEPTVFPRKPIQTDVGIDDIVNRVNAASATAKIAEGVSKAAAVVDGRPACVPPLPTESAKDELEMLDISKKPAEPEKPKKKEPELPPVKEPDPVPDVSDEDEEEPVIESQPTYRKPPITCLKEPIHDGNDNFSDELKSNAQKLLDTLESFNVHAKITEISRRQVRHKIRASAGRGRQNK